MSTSNMKSGILLDDPAPQVMLGAYVTVKCMWCGRRRSPINDRNHSAMNMSICRECANRLLQAKGFFHA
jgi:hypothetical protein